jgi:photosystem II stability/assembly factor-like uncharacterized protein
VLDAVDARTAWALTKRALLRTTDGRRWSVVRRERLRAIDFVDRTHGFAERVKGGLASTADGGRTWRRVPLPVAPSSFCFASAKTGWIASGRSLWRTSDGGGHWRRARVLRATFGTEHGVDLACRGRSVWALFSDGYAASQQAYEAYRTLDGGSTWRPVLGQFDRRRPSLPRISAYSGPFAATRTAAVFSGSCAPCAALGTTTAVSTRDAGRSWRRTTVTEAEVPAAAAMPDARHAWLLTEGVRRHDVSVWATRDGGRTWRLQLRSRFMWPR